MAISIPTDTPLRKPPVDYCPPGTEHWFTLAQGKDAGKRLFYFDCKTGHGEPEATVVFVHGNPETSYTYRHIRDELIRSGRPLRIIAMDHIGFGLSDQADFEMVDMHHSENLLQLVRHLDLRHVTLAIHDWGGPIGVGAFIEDPWRVRNLMVMNTTIFPMPETGPVYTNYPYKWLRWNWFPRFCPAAGWGGVAATAVSHGHPQGPVSLSLKAIKFSGLHLSRRIREDTPEYVWSQTFRTRSNALSSMRNVLQTPRWGHGYTYLDRKHGVQDNTAYYRNMQRRVPEAWGDLPAAGVFGQWDPCGKDEVIAQWHRALPKMKSATLRFPEVGHFVEEYKGAEIAREIIGLNAAESPSA